MTTPYLPPLSPAPTDLQERYQLLGTAEALVAEQFPKALQRGDLEQARELQAQLQAALDDFRSEITKVTVELQDGRFILKPEYEALQLFSEKNSIELERVLEKCTIENGLVLKANFGDMGLTTLEGLKRLTAVQDLGISGNRKINSLEGIPTTALKKLVARECGLTGDLRSIQGAISLESLNVSRNPHLRSLQGMPTSALKYLKCTNCGLSGDLTAIQDAVNLMHLEMSNNRRVRSLLGLPTKNLTILLAADCGLSGGISELESATGLRELNISGNPGIDRESTATVMEKLQERNALSWWKR